MQGPKFKRLDQEKEVSKYIIYYTSVLHFIRLLLINSSKVQLPKSQMSEAQCLLAQETFAVDVTFVLASGEPIPGSRTSERLMLALETGGQFCSLPPFVQHHPRPDSHGEGKAKAHEEQIL